MNGIADFTLPEGGLAFWIVPKVKLDWDAATAQLLKKNINIIHPKQYGQHHVNGFRLSYGALSEEQLEQSIPVISEVFAQFF
jgi:GntR family transcriptional regulator/MocR family aminotransferase